MRSAVFFLTSLSLLLHFDSSLDVILARDRPSLNVISRLLLELSTKVEFGLLDLAILELDRTLNLLKY